LTISDLVREIEWSTLQTFHPSEVLSLLPINGTLMRQCPRSDGVLGVTVSSEWRCPLPVSYELQYVNQSKANPI